MKKFKIRCSAISHIMGGTIGLTDKQQNDLTALEEKDKLTALQEIKLTELKEKRDNPVLPEGAKTYCKDWLSGQLLEYQTMMRNKYTDKGNIMEDEAIDFIADNLGYGFMIKNEVRKSDEWMEGECDIELKNEIIDVKNSWDASTFPLFEDKINSGYDWQLQGYMHLYDKEKAKLIYCLMDTPEHLIEKEARWYSLSQGFDDLEESVYKKFVKNLTYTNIDPKLRIKVYEIERRQEDIDNIKTRVLMCREYINELLEKIS